MPTVSDPVTAEIPNHPLVAASGSQPDQGSQTKNENELDENTSLPGTGSEALTSDGGSSGDQGGGSKSPPEKGLDGE